MLNCLKGVFLPDMGDVSHPFLKYFRKNVREEKMCATAEIYEFMLKLSRKLHDEFIFIAISPEFPLCLEVRLMPSWVAPEEAGRFVNKWPCDGNRST